ncbi:MAG: protein kinase, partial [Elusimicrobiaceae bacterium]|nr:protein kinase [Elusimicrobiaceae bacterium]
MDREKIGSYIASDKLYEGRLTTTYKATHESTGNVRALRIYKFRIPADKADVRRILRIEATVFSELYNNQIVRTYDSGFHKDLFYIVTDLIGGETLANRLSREKTLPAETILKIALNISEAIAYAHDLGIIHSDLTPANIFIREGFADAVITDFRKRCLFDRPELKKLLAPLQDAESMTKWKNYAAPESRLTGDFSTRSDVYQMGLVLHDCIYGAGTAFSQTKEERRDLPPVFLRSVQSCIAQEPNNRPVSAGKLHQEISLLYTEFKARKEKGEEYYDEQPAEPAGRDTNRDTERGDTSRDTERDDTSRDTERGDTSRDTNRGDTGRGGDTSRPIVNATIINFEDEQSALKVQNLADAREKLEVTHDFDSAFEAKKSAGTDRPADTDTLPKTKTWEPGANEPAPAPAGPEADSAPDGEDTARAAAILEAGKNTPAAAPVSDKPEQKPDPDEKKQDARKKIKPEIKQEELSTQEAQKKAELAKLHALEKAKKKREGMPGGTRLFRDGMIAIVLITCYAFYHYFAAALGIHLFTKYREPVSYKLVMITPPMKPSAAPAPNTAAPGADQQNKSAEETRLKA